MLGSEHSGEAVHINLGDALEEIVENDRKRKNPSEFSDTSISVTVEETAKPDLEKKHQVEIDDKYDKEYPGWRDGKTTKTYMVPCIFVDKGKKNAKNGAEAERKLFKTLEHCNDEAPLGRYLINQKGPGFVFHGQKHEGTEIDFIKIDMTHGVTVYECKGMTRTKQAQSNYEDACSQLDKSIPKLGLEDDIPVNRVVAFPLCKRTKIDEDGNTRVLFKEDCENPPSFNKWLTESCRRKYFSTKKLTFEQYLKLVRKFLFVFHTGSGNFNQFKARVVSNPANHMERATVTFYTKEQANVLNADISQDMWISGCAGSGKTFLLKERVKWLAIHYKSDKDKMKLILVVTYNVAINKEIELALRGVEDLQVRVQTYDALICHILFPKKPSYDSMGPSDLQQILQDDSILIKYFKKSGMCKYHHILIDEAQDLSGDWLKLMRKLLNANKMESSIWVFSDPYQLIRRETSIPEEAQTSAFEERLITRVMRNTHEIYEAYEYYLTETRIKPTVGHDVYGMSPEYIVAEYKTEIHEKVVEKLTELQAKKVSYLDIAVITQGNSRESVHSSSTEMRRFLESKNIPCTDAEEGTRKRHYKRKVSDPPVIVDTVQRFKGLEAKVLIFCIVGNWEPRNVDLYVGFSRSFCHLIVLGKSDIITKIEQNKSKNMK